MKTLLIFIAAYLAYIIIKGAFFKKTFKRPAKGKNDGAPKPDGGEEAVSCHGCGTYVPLSSAFTVTHHGKSLYFCAEPCWDKFSSGDQDYSSPSA